MPANTETKLNNLNEEEYIILEITPDKNNIRLHTDPNMLIDGCFTYDNISKNNIKIINDKDNSRF